MPSLKKYQISDKAYFSKDPSKFVAVLSRAYIRHRIDFFCYRDKSSSKKEKKRIIKKLFMIRKRFFLKFLVNSYADLTPRDFGVHLNSKQEKLIKILKRKNKFLITSTHSVKEAKKAIRQGSALVTLSPIFDTPNKGMPKGTKIIKETNDKIRHKIVALGGIVSQNHINKLKDLGIFGFASIRFFVR